ncbi:sensor histidine kinase [Paenibacillus sp. MMS18-CY102]|uniref:sensor histidine kinase n=1 Tax=Paenibacillus sp. MMS18-CY102 TaxID=2682849 RepID=UPI001366433D|nr:sensor histidine kinase [Paenibacillus sp. MMS18-CY102]MWC30276.1 sensor histidine kinase [Paenibacillus sp. MMS18-CY102]
MRAWRFLKLEKPYLILYAVGFLLTIAVVATDPHTSLNRFTIVYALLLNLIMLAGFLIYRYMMNVRAIRTMFDEDAEPLTLEAEAYQEAHEQEMLAHIRALNDVQARQKEHYDFIISWFHEIKTPISVLRLMQQTEIDPRSLEEELSRIEQYVSQALYYAKLDSFNQDYEIVNCDLEALAKAMAKSHAKAFISNKIKLRLDVPSTIVQSDPKWLLFILNQLVTNSLKYSAAQGEIAITAQVTQHEKLLVIRDNGIGIDAKDIPRIFNRGFTGSNGRTHAKSTGMGLYLAQELSKKLGHYLTCESEAGRFTAMTVHFPKHHDPYLHTLMQKPQ